ncbi:MAG TPA: DUF6259 domain-containing protein [Planctomycetota bacterium]|nr:DUF6259 domain-containing protein [Planctomycetota bacterium]
MRPAPRPPPKARARGRFLALLAVALLLASPTRAQRPGTSAAGSTGAGAPTLLPLSAKGAPVSFSLDNGLLRLEFTRALDRVSFDRLVKIAGGSHVFVNDTPPERLWEVGVRQLPLPVGAGSFPVVLRVHPDDSGGPVSHSVATSGGTTTLTVRWYHCRPVAADATEFFHLTLKVAMDAGDPITRWDLEIENHMAGWAPWYASLIHGFAQEAQDTFLVVPATGRLVRNPQATLAASPTATAGYQVPFTNWQHFQLLPYYAADGHGVYYATHDGKATRAKFTNLFGYGNRYELQSAWYLEDSSVPTNGARWASPYPVAMGAFDGDWWDAAQVYRAWAENQPILEKGKLLARTDVPSWAKNLVASNAGYVPANLTDPSVVAEAVNRWQGVRAYEGLQNEDYLLFHWGWYVPGTHGYFDPLPGIGSLFGALRSQGILSGVRVLSFSYGQGAPPSPCGSPAASGASLVNGTPDPFDPTGGTHLDPSTPFAACSVVDFVVNRLLPTGAINFFYDNPYFGDVCYEPSHGHPLGQGGEWLYDSIVSVMQQARAAGRAVDPGFQTTHEASFEGYIRACDATGSGYAFGPPIFVAPAFAADETRIPLQSALVHDYSLMLTANELSDWWNLGAAFTNFNDLNFALAWGFDEGRRLNPVDPLLSAGWANHQLLDPGSPLAGIPDLAQAIVGYTLFLNEAIAVKKTAYGKKYLTFGQRLRPLPLAGVPSVTKTYNALFSAPAAAYSISAPAVLSSVWKASDGSGDVGIVLTNHTSAPVSFTLALDSAAYGLDPALPHDLFLLEPAATTFLQPFTASLSLPVSMPPRSIQVYEIH